MTPPRLALPLVAALLALGVAVPSVRATEADVTAVLTIAAPAAQVHALAGRRAVPGALHALAPAPSHRDAVLRFARQQHLHVVRADAWSVTVTGPPAAVAQAKRERPAEVASVVGGTSVRLHRPHAVKHATGDGEPDAQSAASLRAHYDVPTAWRGAGVTVGVLNLAGWNKGDLQVFADHEGIPLAQGQVTQVPVGADPAELDGFGGEYEVALDAEAVLGAAPEAKERLYFAPNTTGGVISGFEQIAADAELGLVQVVSTSWGGCERDVDQITAPVDRAAYTAALDRIVAAGATLLAATGDAGAFDCGFEGSPDDEAQVDFPASYPNTVAVGGTTITPGQPERGWHDDGFDGYLGNGSGGGESVEQPLPGYQAGLVSQAQRRLVPDLSADADPASGLLIYSGGWSTAGGTSLSAPLLAGMLASTLSSRPDQPGLGNILPSLYASAADLASPGLVDVVGGHNGLFTAGPGYDQVTGLGVPDWSELGTDLLDGGPGAPSVGTAALISRPPASSDPVLHATWTRSLTAPVSVTLPAGSSYTGYGVGEVVPVCSALSPQLPTAVQLTPGAAQGLHTVTLAAFDTGHVCHVVTGSVGYDTVAPTASVSAELLNPQTTQVRLHLGGADTGSGIANYAVQARDAAGALVLDSVTTSHAPVVSVFRAGSRYTVTAIPRDRAGNVGLPAALSVTFAQDDTAFARTGSWTRVRSSSDFQGTHLQTQQAGASVSLTAVTRRLDAYLQRGPAAGYVDAYVDGRKLVRWNLYAASTSAFRPTLGTWAALGSHTMRLVVVGAHPPGSRGSLVLVDGVIAVT